MNSNDRFDSSITTSGEAFNTDSPTPFDPLSIPDDVRRLLAEEEAEAAKPPDPEFERRKHAVAAYRHAVHMRLGGYDRPVKNSPHVQAILALQQRRLNGEEC